VLRKGHRPFSFQAIATSRTISGWCAARPQQTDASTSGSAFGSFQAIATSRTISGGRRSQRYDGGSVTVPSSRGRLAALLVLLLASGASGLAYQVLWLRELSLILGVTVHAAATVLAAFMGGLALGGIGAGRVLARLRRPLLAFGLAEIGIGVSALAVGLAFDRGAPVDAAIHHALGWSNVALTAGRFAVAAALLLIPTSLMGLTMPLVCASATVRASFGQRLGLVYGVNTAGGILGALASGFYALGALGSDATLRIAATVSIGVGLAAIALSRATNEAPETAAADAAPAALAVSGGIPPRVLAVVVAASGFGSMALEVLWFRALVQQIAATTYAFTSMLAVVLTGIAVGSLGASWLMRRRRDWTGWLAGLYYAMAAAALGSLGLLAGSALIGPAGAPPGPFGALAMLPATLCMGATLPLALQASLGAGGTGEQVARRLGGLYAANVAGAVAGSILGGFALLPLWGVRSSIIGAGALFAVAAVLIRVSTGGFGIRRDLAALAALIALAVMAPDPLDVAFARRHGSGDRPAWRYDGAQSTVMVHLDRQQRVLFIDGLHQANDRPDMVKLHRTIGQLAMALHPDPKRALVIGLGGGATAGTVGRHGSPTLHIVELSDGVRLAAPLFAHVSYDVLRQPGTVLHMDDARSFLLTTQERFDVITADIIQPTHAGAGGLYSREYFQRARDRLRPGGLVLQWIGRREDTPYKLIARTFLDVFPETTVWEGGTLLVGTLSPLTISRAAFERRLADPATREALAAVDIPSFDALASRYTASAATLRAFVGPGPLLTDDRPLVEYFRTLPRRDATVRLDQLHGDVRTIVAP
jgi:spermidine synthase